MTLQKTKKYKARELRKLGKSYSEILKEINVSKSTLSLWLRDIPLTKKQKESLRGRQKSRYNGSKKRQQDRIELTKKIIKESREETKNLINDPLFLSGLMLYWGEGTKHGESVSFSNSDYNMIEMMMRWFREICLVPEEKFRIQIHIHSLHSKNEIKEYWSKITGIPKDQFHKIIVKKTSLRHRKNKLYQGTCYIRINNRNLFRKIMGWKIGVLKYFNIKDKYQIPK